MKDIHTVLKSTETINDAKDLLSQIKRDPLVKINHTAVPWDETLFIKDYGIKVKGAQEDTVFARNKPLWVNVRRGNTIIQNK